jgi:DtxR family Mn-dependent transcriptional regulator
MSKLRRKSGAVRLSDCQPGFSYEVLRVYEKDSRFLEFLESRHLRPGARFRILRREYDETMELSVEGRRAAPVHLGKPATSRIWVKRTPA